MGAAGLLALDPLLKAGSRHTAAPAVRAPARRVAAVVPCHVHDRFAAVAVEALRHVDEVVLVDDGSPAPLDDASLDDRITVVRLDVNSGKGDAVAAGAETLLRRADPPDAIVVLDADGQHPPERIPAFVAAACEADVVIGDRRADRADMPLTRRFTNAVSSALLSLVARRRLPDTQCGMRLYRTGALELVPLPPGRYEAETVHLKAAMKEGLTVSWVRIPAIYDGAPSHFRPLRDTLRVLRAILGRGPREEAVERRVHRPSREFAHAWSKRLSVLVGVTIAFGLVMPLIGPVDERLFLSINGLGDGPAWLYEALDPHTRNYILVSLFALAGAFFLGARVALATALVVTFAGLFSDLLVQSVYLVYDRPRPEEVLSAQFSLVEGRHWSHIASFPSGHLVVTTAIAVAAMSLVPALRAPLWIYVGLIAFTRIAFGAHFPMDVIVGLVFGYVVGRFSAELPYAMGALRGKPASAIPFAEHWHVPKRALRRA
jgi:membrane-associated phospholipid phosphatase